MIEQNIDKRPWRQFTVSFIMVLALGACELGKDFKDLATGLRKQDNPVNQDIIKGGIAADEPRAVRVGRDILNSGGSAVDAATAMYLAMAVAIPSSAGLGGGGVCVVHDGWTGNTEAVDFLARPPKSVPATATRPSAVPGNIRGFFAMHAKYGRLRWPQIVAPAESMARFGINISRAFANDLGQTEEALMAEPSIREIFARADGAGLVKEGDPLKQLELAAVLSRLRSLGPTDFYSGETARKLVEAVNSAGGSLTFDDLNNYHPVWSPAILVPFKGLTAHFAPPPAAAGAVAAEMWSMLVNDDRYEDTKPEARSHLLAEAASRAFAGRGQWLREDGTTSVDVSFLAAPERAGKLMAGYREDQHVPITPAPAQRQENPSASSFAVIDQDGYGVACAMTMNNLFGTGRIASGTGILIAAMPGKGGRGPTSLGPVLITDESQRLIYFAGAAAGGVAAPTALVSILAGTQIDEAPLEDVMNAKRIHHSGAPDMVYYEQGLSNSELKNLAQRGHTVAATKNLARVNAVSCFEGLPGTPEQCSARTDPRGFGDQMNVGF